MYFRLKHFCFISMSDLEIYIYNLNGQVCLKFKTSLTVQSVHVRKKFPYVEQHFWETRAPIGALVIMTLALFSGT